MSAPYDPDQPHWGHLPPPSPPPLSDPAHERLQPPKRKSWPARHKVLTGLLAVGALFVVGGVATAAGSKSGGSGQRAIASASATAAPATTDAALDPTTDPPPAAGYTPSVRDFVLVLKVTSKQCFGEAGCNVEARVDFKTVAARVPDDASVLVTFEIRGVQDGAVTDTIRIDGGNYDPAEEFFQTASSASKPTVVVTAVEEA
jgi:hypothetical protein